MTDTQYEDLMRVLERIAASLELRPDSDVSVGTIQLQIPPSGANSKEFRRMFEMAVNKAQGGAGYLDGDLPEDKH